MDRGAWWATVHGVAKCWTRLSNFTLHSSKAQQSPLKVTGLTRILTSFELKIKENPRHFFFLGSRTLSVKSEAEC